MTMLHLHHADELSPLIDALADVLRVAPTDAFTPDVVVIPTTGLRDATMAGAMVDGAYFSGTVGARLEGVVRTR